MTSRILMRVATKWPVGLLLFTLVSCSLATPAPSRVPVRSTASVATPLAATLSTKTISLVAHRGGAGLAAENTLAAFRIGIAFNSDFLEMDVHLTKDGVPVVMHDPTIDRTTDGKGRIAGLTLAELGRFSTHSTSQSYREPIPTLTQVLDLAKSKNVQLQVEIKVDADKKRYPGIERQVLEEITARDMLDRVNILALEFDTLKEIRTINPRVKTVSLMGEEFFRSMGNRDPAALVDDVISFSDEIAVNKDFLSLKLVEAAHKRNMLVGVWTVDTASEMQRFIEIGVDSVTTNRPDIFKAMLGR